MSALYLERLSEVASTGSIDMGLFLAAASVALVVSQLVQRHQSY